MFMKLDTLQVKKLLFIDIVVLLNHYIKIIVLKKLC